MRVSLALTTTHSTPYRVVVNINGDKETAMKLSDFQAAIGILVLIGIALQIPWGAVLTMAT